MTSTEQKRPRIAVVGDIMLDVDAHCEMTRIAAEAPIPVCKAIREEKRLGGAGNVARMCKALGADVMLIGFFADETRKLARLEGIRRGGLSHDECHPTVKTRFVSDGCYVGVRIDRDVHESVEDEDQLSRFLDGLEGFNPDSIIVCDHAKGVVTSPVLDKVYRIACEAGAVMIVDPKSSTPIRDGWGVLLVGHSDEMPNAVSVSRIIKHGAGGLEWVFADDRGRLSSTARWISDPLGAGDQLIAALSVLRSLGHGSISSISLANLAAGLQCERMGCVPVTMDDLMAASSTRDAA